MKKLILYFKNDQGFSYVEVILAVVILGIASSSLLNAIASENQVASKYTINTIDFSYLSTAAEIIAKEDYVPCNQLASKDINGVFNPYSNVATFLKSGGKNPVQIWEVTALGSDKTWHACGDSFWSNSNEKPSPFQRIKICIPQSNFTDPCSSSGSDENYYWKYVFKNLAKISAGYNVKTSTSSNICSATNPNSYNIVSGYIQSISLLACNTAYAQSASSNLSFYTLAGDGPQAISTTCAISASSDLSIAINGSTLLICPGKTYVPNAETVKKITIEIGAIDINNSIYYNPISLAVNIYYPPTLVDPGQILTESQLALFGCSSNSQGCSTKSLTYVGGIPNIPVYFALSSVTGNSSLTGNTNFSVDSNLGNLSLTGLVTNSGSTPSDFAVNVALSGGGLPSAALQNPFNVTVNPLINLSSNFSMSCGLTACTAGPITTMSSSGLLNLASLVIKSSDTSVTPSISNPIFNSATSDWSFSVSASFTCRSYVVAKKTYYYRTSATFTLSDSVASLSSKYSSNTIAFTACA
jgi:type II secretory pathway pseudopilin PulG